MALISVFISIAFVTYFSRNAYSNLRPREYLSRILAGMSVFEEAFALDENVCFMALHSLKNIPGACYGNEYSIVYRNFIRRPKYDFLMFWIFVVQDKKNPYACCKLIRDST